MKLNKGLKRYLITAAVYVGTGLATHIVIKKYDEHKMAKTYGIKRKEYKKLKKEGKIIQ